MSTTGQHAARAHNQIYALPAHTCHPEGKQLIFKTSTVNQRLKTAKNAVISVLQSWRTHRGRIFHSGAKKERFSAPFQKVQIVGHVSHNACSETTFKGRANRPWPQQLCDIPSSRSPPSHFFVGKHAVGCEHVAMERGEEAHRAAGFPDVNTCNQSKLSICFCSTFFRYP